MPAASPSQPMPNRRTFLKHATGTALATGSALAGCAATQPDPKPLHHPQAATGLPVVLATWAPNTKATAAAMAVLEAGGNSLDAVEAGARVPEADPEDTSVGLGGWPDRTGIVTLDACIMNARGDAGSVTFLPNVLHPISVARKVMEQTPHVMLSGQGALAFAREHGFEEVDLLTPKAKAAYDKWLADQSQQMRMFEGNHDTIGLVAIDAVGDIAGACTTSGAGFKLHGRVGDSPIIGAGMFVDNDVGGACATGWGELVMKTLGSFLIVELMRQGKSPQQACEEAIARIVRKYPDELKNDFGVGYVAIDKQGRHGAYSVGPGLTYVRYQNGKNEVFTSASSRGVAT